LAARSTCSVIRTCGRCALGASLLTDAIRKVVAYEGAPVPAGSSGPYGYPIMVVYSAGQNVQFRAAEIVAPNGTRLAF